MRAGCRSLIVVWCVVASVAVLPVESPDAAEASCSTVLGTAKVSAPKRAVAWRASVEARTAVFYRLPGKRSHASHWLTWREAPWLLVVGRARSAKDRCWLPVRLPWRPNTAVGWIDARRVELQATPWRIVVSTRWRTLKLYRAGKLNRRIRVVVGKPSTPTPAGLFAVVWAIPWHPNDFVGSWVLELTAHSNVLREFDGGDGTVGIHGRGGASLVDPLGCACSHGCIRRANRAIDWLVRTIGEDSLPGTPVRVS